MERRAIFIQNGWEDSAKTWVFESGEYYID